MLVATKVSINKLKGVWYPHEGHRLRTFIKETQHSTIQLS